MTRPPEGVHAIFVGLAALIGITVACYLTKNHDATKPNWAVRLLATRGGPNYLSKRRDFPRREASGAIFLFAFAALYFGELILWAIFAEP